MSKQSRRPTRAARHVSRPPAKSTGGRRPSKNLYWLLAALVAAGLVAGVSLVGKGGNKNTTGAIRVGQTAPAVAGRDVISGREISSSQYRGKDVLYYLSEGVMCQACLVQIQALQQHAAHLARLHLRLVSITNDDPTTLAQAGHDYRITTPLIADQTRAITRSFGVLGGIPAGVGMHADTANHTFVLVDGHDRVRFVKDYPNMWVNVNTLLKQLPKVS